MPARQAVCAAGARAVLLVMRNEALDVLILVGGIFDSSIIRLIRAITCGKRPHALIS